MKNFISKMCQLVLSYIGASIEWGLACRIFCIPDLIAFIGAFIIMILYGFALWGLN